MARYEVLIRPIKGPSQATKKIFEPFLLEGPVYLTVSACIDTNSPAIVQRLSTLNIFD